MDLEPREMLAFAIIAAIFIVSVPLTIRYVIRRRADKLRRRGIKSYNRSAARDRSRAR